MVRGERKCALRTAQTEWQSSRGATGESGKRGDWTEPGHVILGLYDFLGACASQCIFFSLPESGATSLSLSFTLQLLNKQKGGAEGVWGRRDSWWIFTCAIVQEGAPVVVSLSWIYRFSPEKQQRAARISLPPAEIAFGVDSPCISPMWWSTPAKSPRNQIKGSHTFQGEPRCTLASTPHNRNMAAFSHTFFNT